jgi:hypothetical protein
MSNRSLPILDDPDALRPRTFGDCLRDGWGDDGTPCPWVACAHHLVWARATSGGGGVGSRGIVAEPGEPHAVVRLELLLDDDSDDAPWLLDEMPHTCALRVAQEPRDLGEVGEAFGVSRERIRQITNQGLDALDTYRNRPVLSDLRDGREVSRPDLAANESASGDLETIKRRLRELAPRERVMGGYHSRTNTAAFVNAAPVRVLHGDERAQRIAELKARGGAPQSHTNTEETVVMPLMKSEDAGDRARAALDEYAKRSGLARWKVAKAVKISTSTLAQLNSGGSCLPAVAGRVEAALKALGNGPAPVIPPRKNYPRKSAAKSQAKGAAKPARTAAAPVAPRAGLASELARVAAVIDMLGGIDRAERIAAALKGAA